MAVPVGSVTNGVHVPTWVAPQMARLYERYLGADWLATTKRKDSPFSSIYNAGYGLVNLTALTRLNKQWTLQGRVENLTDKNYTLADGYNTAGRSLYVELRYGHKS